MAHETRSDGNTEENAAVKGDRFPLALGSMRINDRIPRLGSDAERALKFQPKWVLSSKQYHDTIIVEHYILYQFI